MTKKIMFSDAFCLTQAVLDGTKTMTRRKFTLTLDKNVDGKLIRVYPSKVFFDNGKWLFDYEGRIYNLPKENYPRYKVGEVVAIAQSYKEIYTEKISDFAKHNYHLPREDAAEKFRKLHETCAGWRNKMFVKAELMPHHIQITDVKVERLQSLSDDEVLREGIYPQRFFNKVEYVFATKGKMNNTPVHRLKTFPTPREAFAALIDKISGKGTWESNPWVVAYSFELID